MKKTMFVNLLLAVAFSASLAHAAKPVDDKATDKTDVTGTAEAQDADADAVRRRIGERLGNTSTQRAQRVNKEEAKATVGDASTSKATADAKVKEKIVNNLAEGKQKEAVMDIFTRHGADVDGAIDEIAKRYNDIFGERADKRVITAADIRGCKE